MELPQELKNLYRHWEHHTIPHQSPSQEVFTGTVSFEDIHTFVQERMRIWEKKYSKVPAPFTEDPILGKYRFCNMLRELDRQTIDFHTLLNPIRDDFPLWLLNMFFCRLVARPETIKAVGLLGFDTTQNKEVYTNFIQHPRPRYGTPYVFPVSVILNSKYPTRELFCTEYLPSVMKEIAAEIETWDKVSVYDGVETILPKFGFNLHFLWTEVLIDVAYQFPEYLDLYKPFPVGPGAQPTFAKINNTIEPHILAAKLATLNISSGLTYKEKNILFSAENWEGIGCEYRKYTNLQEGKGRKRIYTRI